MRALFNNGLRLIKCLIKAVQLLAVGGLDLVPPDLEGRGHHLVLDRERRAGDGEAAHPLERGQPLVDPFERLLLLAAARPYQELNAAHCLAADLLGHLDIVLGLGLLIGAED